MHFFVYLPPFSPDRVLYNGTSWPMALSALEYALSHYEECPRLDITQDEAEKIASAGTGAIVLAIPPKA